MISEMNTNLSDRSGLAQRTEKLGIGGITRIDNFI